MEITSALTGLVATLNTVKELAKSILNERDQAKLQASIRQFQSEVSEALANANSIGISQLTLINRIAELERKANEYENFAAEAEHYELCKTGKLGVFVYAPKAGVADAQPAHYLCSTCFNRRQKSILQPGYANGGRTKCLRCHTCDTALPV